MFIDGFVSRGEQPAGIESVQSEVGLHRKRRQLVSESFGNADWRDPASLTSEYYKDLLKK